MISHQVAKYFVLPYIFLCFLTRLSAHLYKNGRIDFQDSFHAGWVWT